MLLKNISFTHLEHINKKGKVLKDIIIEAQKKQLQQRNCNFRRMSAILQTSCGSGGGGQGAHTVVSANEMREMSSRVC